MASKGDTSLFWQKERPRQEATGWHRVLRTGGSCCVDRWKKGQSLQTPLVHLCTSPSFSGPLLATPMYATMKSYIHKAETSHALFWDQSAAVCSGQSINPAQNSRWGEQEQHHRQSCSSTTQLQEKFSSQLHTMDQKGAVDTCFIMGDNLPNSFSEYQNFCPYEQRFFSISLSPNLHNTVI